MRSAGALTLTRRNDRRDFLCRPGTLCASRTSCAKPLSSTGKVLAGSKVNGNTYIYDPATDAWSPGPTKLNNDPSYGETWTKLADGSVLSFDIWAGAAKTQRLDPATMSWLDAGVVPVSLQINSTLISVGPAVCRR